ncbi:hypothetical protein [Lelliottia nimipressuralis]|uniref:Uncharacterized protein n=1 Tax=Lelliottia nimipressuralis TaxID=69220 RepID=A0ABD4K732_9ENTR|nr:hypothetical protein [Lelliottia nimipressuralis]MBF4177258.1 hypothetical protein [Lelliottia nimipressuralis]
MKNLLKSIKGILNLREDLAVTKSWASFLEKEVEYLTKKSVQDNIALAELVRENEIISGENARLVKKEISNAIKLTRERELNAVVTPCERDFLRVCRDIYANGKVVKGRTFTRMMGAAMREHRIANKNHQGVNNGSISLQCDRNSPKGDRGTKERAAVK